MQACLPQKVSIGMELFNVTQLPAGYGALAAKLDGVTIGL